MKIETESFSNLQTRQADGPTVFTAAPTSTPATTPPSAIPSKSTITSGFISKATTTTTKYHRAAIDGYVDMLCDASKKDSNYATNDCVGFTPTLLAAYHGHLEALRILVGKGGDPEKTASDGSSALHLAAARNHLNCVSFLVNFGVNMWALDNELHTAKDVAAIEQRKEVLDYLDQMMAKQSALNTKNVQKLKEKAKVATEKRLKQMRKAQLKAIKQVEKDEKYLVKLSNNRRLLKAAHSISDIKLVGRSDAISFTPSDKSAGSVYSKMSDQSTQRSSGILKDKFSSSSSGLTTNFINHKMYLDRLKSTGPDNARYNQLNSVCQFKTNLTTSQSNSKSIIATVTSGYSDESAYGSSISSTSGYLSSCSTGITTRDKINYARPKYSDLVAVGNELPKVYISSSSEASTASSSSMLKSSSSSKQQQNNEQQSVKSNSTIGTKLRGFGGVSRKVQLKRLLLINASSNNDQTSNNSATLSTSLSDGARFENRSSNNSSKGNIDSETNSSFNNGSNKLCNVQPAIKLKLSSIDSHQRQQNNNKSNNNQPDSTSSVSNIKWPPAPTMTRAVSEPDLGSKLRLSDDEGDDQSDVDDDRRWQSGDQNRVEALDNSNDDDGNDDVADETDQKDKEETSYEVTKADSYRHKVNSFESRGSSENSEDQTRNGKYAEETQYHLLTKCLSQLKMRHQESINKQHQELNNSNLEINKVHQSDQLNRQFGRGNDTSDELLQHQISAGQLILKPSLIKQQQQQQQQQQQLRTVSYNQTTGIEGNSFKHQYQFPASKATTVSVDSIGSASSLVKRNQSSSSTKSNHSSSSPTSSISYSSSYTSSFEASKPSIVINMSAPTRTVQAGTEQQHNVVFKGPSTTMMQCSKQVVASKSLGSSNNKETIATFLLANGLFDLSEVFAKERIDLDALMLLSEDDLKSLNILLGPRRKLLKAIKDRRRDLNMGPMYVMVDTQL